MPFTTRRTPIYEEIEIPQGLVRHSDEVIGYNAFTELYRVRRQAPDIMPAGTAFQYREGIPSTAQGDEPQIVNIPRELLVEAEGGLTLSSIDREFESLFRGSSLFFEDTRERSKLDNSPAKVEFEGNTKVYTLDLNYKIETQDIDDEELGE